ncbi:MAG: TlpA family protein disulfide reductase [Planctomycetota bacterium]|nr:TlpA family protein disulfide reductase [Planctomycetota bacterium]
MKFTRTGILAGLGFLVLLAILAVPAFTAERAETASTEDRSETPAALDFAFEDINPKSPSYGETIRLSDVYRERGVVLNFVASWCGPCRKEIPILESLHSDDAATVLVVAADENGAGPENVQIVIDRAGATMPVLFAPVDEAEKIFEFYTYQVVPATYFIDKRGNLKRWHTGMRSKAKLVREIDEHLGS